MQPKYGSWEYELPASQGDQWGGSTPSSGPAEGGFEDPNVAVACGLVDVGKGKGKGKASSCDGGAEADFPPHPPSLAGNGGSSPGMQAFGKGGVTPGKAAGGGGYCPGGKGDVLQPGFSYKGKLAPRKAGFETRPPPTMPPTTKPGGYPSGPMPAAPCDGSSKAPAPQQLPPSLLQRYTCGQKVVALPNLPRVLISSGRRCHQICCCTMAGDHRHAQHSQ